ncbi:ABC transporter ATP-binding protein [Poseidonocella sp. HB161398]|uniref:ABC transporter ATP-binding protein n=1 Tax=Poseidonocella sp. HB161398 TaxID=2320855 RepID=UPI00110806CC|nr:ABC transporter ATP-binding protein [Poseidonocella sp. HB161398]
MELIRAEALSVGAGRRPVAEGIGFALAPGGILAVLGPNGAGKTTLFRTLLGLLAPHGGAVHLGGQPLGGLSRARIARHLAYVPQAMDVPFPYTVADYVLAGRSARLGPFAAPGRRDAARAAAALEELGIASLARHPVTRLSGGERQLAMIARALAQDAPALILDEPASALDFGNRERLAELLSGLAARGYGLVFSSHDPAFAVRLADRILAIGRDGRAAAGPARDMTTDARLGALYGLSAGAVRRARGG